jgi:hypothetical protein
MAARPSRLRRRFAPLISRASTSLASQWWRTRRVLRPRIPALARTRVARPALVVSCCSPEAGNQRGTPAYAGAPISSMFCGPCFRRSARPQPHGRPAGASERHVAALVRGCPVNPGCGWQNGRTGPTAAQVDTRTLPPPREVPSTRGAVAAARVEILIPQR